MATRSGMPARAMLGMAVLRNYRAGERLTLPVARLGFSIATSRYAPISADVVAKALARLTFDQTTERVGIVESEQPHAIGR